MRQTNKRPSRKVSGWGVFVIAFPLESASAETGTLNATVFLTFLGRLLRGADEKVFLIVDHLKVHEAAAVEAWVAQRRDRIEIFYLPRWAPELNPDEYLNHDTKAGVNAEKLPDSRDELRVNLHCFMQSLSIYPDAS